MRRQYTYRGARSFGLLVNLTMTYDGNQLKKVTDQCADLTYAGAMDFKDGADKTTEYTWDANGNMTQDLNKKIWRIKYNVLNLPEQIDYEDGHIVRYTYAADGRKLRVQYLVSNVSVIELNGLNAVSGSTMELMGGNIPPSHPIDTTSFPGHHVETTLLTMDYCGNHIYRNGVLERTMNDYGYLADSTYYYYIKDYQGNVRAVIDQSGALKEINNYYPYGGLMGGAVTGIQPDKYGGKELDRENGIDWYDFEARYQDPMLPMFTTQDPIAEQTPSISPYAYCAGNPVRYIDPSGMYFTQENSDIVNELYCVLFDRLDELSCLIENENNKKNRNEYTEQRKEVALSIVDLYTMSLDKEQEYMFANAIINDNKPETILTNDGVIKMYVEISENSYGSYIHEARHGGQISRNEFSVLPNGSADDRFSSRHEISAYRAQLSIDGYVRYFPYRELKDNDVESLMIIYRPKNYMDTITTLQSINNKFLKRVSSINGSIITKTYNYPKTWYK